MLIEKDVFEMLFNNPDLKNIFSDKIYYLEADKESDSPYLVVQPILLGSTREVNFFKPLFQLDIYHSDKFKASEISGAVIDILKNVNGIYGNTHLSKFLLEKRQTLRLEKDLWKIPVDTTFNCKGN